MEGPLFIALCMFLVFAKANEKKTRFARDHILEGRNITVAVIAKYQETVVTGCANSCLDSDICKSFFYNTVTRECQHHEEIFTSQAGATDQVGLRYYYTIEHWCPMENGFELLAENGPCVKFHSDGKTWHDANQTCVSNSPSSRLVILDDREKNDLVKSAGMNHDFHLASPVWIGLKEYVQHEYKWVDGGDLDFTDWGIYDESQVNSDDCGQMIRSDGWRWGKTSCSATRHYICEITG